MSTDPHFRAGSKAECSASDERVPDFYPTGDYPVLATARLRLRAFALADIEPLVSAIADPRTAEASLVLPEPSTTIKARQWIESHPAQLQAYRSIHWAVSQLEDDRLVGYVGLQNIKLPDRKAELGFWIGERRERKQLAAEAAEAAIAFAFTDLNLNRVWSRHLASHQLFGRILSMVGMRPEGILRENFRKWDHFEDVKMWGILRSDWLSSL